MKHHKTGGVGARHVGQNGRKKGLNICVSQ
jgi:hypothetical protein